MPPVLLALSGRLAYAEKPGSRRAPSALDSAQPPPVQRSRIEPPSAAPHLMSRSPFQRIAFGSGRSTVGRVFGMSPLPEGRVSEFLQWDAIDRRSASTPPLPARRW